MPEPPKRPGLPVPDPNWELELHGPVGDARKGGPESKDEMLAHALLRAEPDPLDLELAPPARPSAPELVDEFGDVDRTTLPPPEAMSLHVARMMAQAELIETLEDEGDRPTPLIEDERFSTQRSGVAGREGRSPAGREPRPSRPRAAAAVVRFETDRKDTPLMQLDVGDFGLPRAPSGSLPAVPSGSPARSAPGSAARPPPAAPARTPPAAPARSPSGGYSRVSPGAAGASPSVETRAAPVGRMEMERKPTPEPLSLARVPHSQGALDLSDLPAVFALDAFGMDEPSSEAAVSPTFAASPPSSEPAISPPFASLDALELAAELEAVSRPAGPPREMMSAIEARFSAGDYGRALVLAESALDAHPADPEITQYAESCREMLYRRYLERLGAGDHIPRLAMQRSALTGLTLDHRAGFLLSCVDGGSTLEEIIDVSAMPRLEAVRLLYELVQEGVIEMVAPR